VTDAKSRTEKICPALLFLQRGQIAHFDYSDIIGYADFPPYIPSRENMMKITCISASNIEPARSHSASTRACEIIRQLIQEKHGKNVDVDILPLIDYEMKPCRMCGSCIDAGICVRDDAFNRIYAAIKESDALFVVCPHYAPFPSKLMILLEKLQEIWYLSWCQDNHYRAAYAGLPLGLVGHGGQSDQALPYYQKALLDPLAAAFSSVEMKVVGAGDDAPNGVVFGITDLRQNPGSIFVSIDHDWECIRLKLAPLVDNVMTEVLASL